MKKNELKRRDFLKRLGLSLPALPLLFGNPAHAGEQKGDDKRADDCDVTDQATAGPFYVANSLETVNINVRNMPGKPMSIAGTVFDGDQTVAGARVEIWHSDGEGVYHPMGGGDISDYKPSQINLRGFAITNSQGQFAFRSIQPGLYTGRRRHIHWRVTAAGFVTLTTQSYWLSEKGTAREKNDWVDRNTEDCRYVAFEENGRGAVAGIFNMYLEKKT